jgi:hypothetical protein
MGGPLVIGLIIILSLGAVGFAFLSLHFYGRANTAAKSLNTQTTAAATKAAADQKTKDALAYSIAGESPFSEFDAPDAYGAFVIKFPKDWASWVDEEQDGIQVTLILNPNFVTVTNGTPGLAAAKITLQEETGTQFINQYTGLITEGTMHQSNITVSGQPGYNFTGAFPNQRSVREVVVPVRDKVLVFDNENKQYATEFDEIVAQAKINP